MTNRVLFVYDNLKVTLNPGDQPYYGFDILVGEAQCSAEGTLYDLGSDAGFVPHGKTRVRGQIWIADTTATIEELKEFAYPKGNVRLVPIHVTITEENEKLVIPSLTFALEQIPRMAKPVQSGFWPVRCSLKGS
jgi:hypothetical protein